MHCVAERVVFEFCIECDKVTPFVNTLKCLYCGCDSPFGEFYDEDISAKEMDEYLLDNTVIVGEER